MRLLKSSKCEVLSSALSLTLSFSLTNSDQSMSKRHLYLMNVSQRSQVIRDIWSSLFFIILIGTVGRSVCMLVQLTNTERQVVFWPSPWDCLTQFVEVRAASKSNGDVALCPQKPAGAAHGDGAAGPGKHGHGEPTEAAQGEHEPRKGGERVSIFAKGWAGGGGCKCVIRRRYCGSSERHRTHLQNSL